MTETKPWLRFYGDVPPTLDYPAIRVDEAVRRSAARVPRISWRTTSSARPREVELRELPLTKLGKADFRALVDEEQRCASAARSD